MISRSASSSVRPVDLWSLPATQLVHLTFVFATSLLLLTGGWLLIRRLQGALESPLSMPALVFLGSALSITLVGQGFFERRMVTFNGTTESSGAVLRRTLMTVAVLILGFAISHPGTSAVPLMVFWGLVVVGALRAWSPSALVRRVSVQWRGDLSRDNHGDFEGAIEANEGSADRESPEATLLDKETESEDGELPADVSQRVLRARDERGAEIIYGSIRCEFAPGQRQQSVHIAFCPPLVSISEFTADQVLGPTVQIKPAMVETFGAAIEVKLASPGKGPAEVQIQFFAFEKPTGVADS